MTTSHPLPMPPEPLLAAAFLPGSVRARIAAGLLVSAALHAGFLMALRLPQQLPQDAGAVPVRLTVRLLPAPARPEPAPRVAATPPAARHSARPAARTPNAPAPVAEPAPQVALPAAGSKPDSPADPAPAPAIDLMAARREAATFARELNKEAEGAAEGSARRAFRNTRQALLDRRFEDAYKAAHRWNGALPMKEVTRASDGNMRVYVLSTPLGKVCMFTRILEHPRPGTQFTGEQTYYGLCNR